MTNTTTVTQADKAEALSGKECEKANKKASIAIKSHLQSYEATEKVIHEAALINARHAETYGDCRQADTLVKMLQEDARTQLMMHGLIAWYRSNTQIRWNAKGEVSLDREAKFDLAKGEAEPFFESQKYVEAQEAANAAGKRVLQPATYETFRNRFFGLRRHFTKVLSENMEGQDHPQGFKSEADKEKTFKAIKLLESVFKSFEEGKPIAEAMADVKPAADSKGQSRRKVREAKGQVTEEKIAA